MILLKKILTGLILSVCALLMLESAHSGEFSGKKVLVTYYSRLGGNTKIVSEMIAQKTDATLLRLEPVIPYPEDYKVLTAGLAQEQLKNDVRPELKDYGDITDYEVVFVATPVWGGQMAPVVKSFLAAHNFSGKNMIPIITHGGGGSYNIPADMAQVAKGAHFVSPEFSINGRDSLTADQLLDSYLLTIGF